MSLHQNFGRIATGARYILLPFPGAIFLSGALITIVDHLVRPDRSQIIDDGPDPLMGGIFLLMISGIAQVLLGIPSLIILDRTRGNWGAFTLTGGGLAVLLSLAMASFLRAPQFGETLAWMFTMALLFFGIPLVVSYLAAFAIKQLLQKPPHLPRRTH